MADVISRRTVAKGAAWAVPAVTMASAAPALAASPTCKPTLDIQYYWYYNWGNAGSDTQVTTQKLTFDSLQFFVYNAPKGVRIQSIEWGMWMNLRYQSNPVTPYRSWGIPYPDSRTDGRSSDPTTTAQLPCVGQSLSNGTCGWSNLTWGGVQIANGVVVSGTKRTFRPDANGVPTGTHDAWQLKQKWVNTGKNFTVTAGKECDTITTGRMGAGSNSPKTGFDSAGFVMNSTQTAWSSAAGTHHLTIHGAIAHLSDGTSVTLDNAPAGNPSSWL